VTIKTYSVHEDEMFPVYYLLPTTLTITPCDGIVKLSDEEIVRITAAMVEFNACRKLIQERMEQERSVEASEEQEPEDDFTERALEDYKYNLENPREDR
jgi:hypothetical protein